MYIHAPEITSEANVYTISRANTARNVYTYTMNKQVKSPCKRRGFLLVIYFLNIFNIFLQILQIFLQTFLISSYVRVASELPKVHLIYSLVNVIILFSSF